MKRKDLLNFIKNQLIKLKSDFPVIEVYLAPGFENISTPRTFLITGAPNTEAIINLFQKYCTSEMQTSWFVQYEKPDDILQSKLIPENAADLNLNWRGRLWDWKEIEKIKDETDFHEKFFASYWRFIVTQKEADYFARFEISPTYINPGHSTPGFSDFHEQIKNFLDFLRSKKERWQVDPVYDRLVFFARKEPQKAFTRCKPNFFNNKNFLSYQDFENELNKQTEDNIIKQIYDSILKELK